MKLHSILKGVCMQIAQRLWGDKGMHVCYLYYISQIQCVEFPFPIQTLTFKYKFVYIANWRFASSDRLAVCTVCVIAYVVCKQSYILATYYGDTEWMVMAPPSKCNVRKTIERIRQNVENIMA